MRNIEVGREVIGYIGKTAKDISGIGPAQRIRRSGNSMYVVPAEALMSLVMPLTMKLTEGGPARGIKAFLPALTFPTELAVNFAALGLLLTTDIQTAFIAKFGYNFLVQVAPDVAKLPRFAKNKIFQRAK